MAAGEDPNPPPIMGAGMSGMPVLQEPQAVQPIDVNEQPITIDEQPIDVNEQVIIDRLVRWLEEIWVQEEGIRETYSEAEWQEFIDSVKNPYQ